MENNNIEVLENCQLEWDKARGTLYVHDKDSGRTILRIDHLKPSNNNRSLKNGMIDIIKPERVSYPSLGV